MVATQDLLDHPYEKQYQTVDWNINLKFKTPSAIVKTPEKVFASVQEIFTKLSPWAKTLRREITLSHIGTHTPELRYCSHGWN